MLKEIIIFPYINISKIIKMGDLEIHPVKDYKITKELNSDEGKIFKEFLDSFRQSLFQKGKTPKKAEGIGLLRYKGSILITSEDMDSFDEEKKILFFLLKLHISHDFFNPWMSQLSVKSFDFFGFNLKNNLTLKFGHMGECISLHSTVPENINGIGETKFYPLDFCTNNIPVELRTFNGGDEIFGIHPKLIDITDLYIGIIKNEEYYQRFLNLSLVHYGLEQQDSIFFYYALIPSIIEILNPPGGAKKKESGVTFGVELDKLILDNDYQKIKCCGKKMELGVIARTISIVYDTRNDLLHEGKKSFDRLQVNFKGLDIKIHGLFQLILKYAILKDFIDKGIINNIFCKVKIEGSVFTTGMIDIKVKKDILTLDSELLSLIEKAKSDKKYKK